MMSVINIYTVHSERFLRSIAGMVNKAEAYMNNEQNQSENLEAMLDQNDVAAVLKVSPKTLEYWRCKGIGPRYIKVGKLARYLESDVKAFIVKLSEGGKP